MTDTVKKNMKGLQQSVRTIQNSLKRRQKKKKTLWQVKQREKWRGAILERTVSLLAI